MFCKECGTENADGMSFCKNCGSRLQSSMSGQMHRTSGPMNRMSEQTTRRSEPQTTLGISIGLMAAAIYFIGFFGGYVAVALLAGYVLLRERDEWLRRSAVKAAMLLIVISIATTVISLFPSALGILSNILGIFSIDFTYYGFSLFTDSIVQLILAVEKILFLILGAKALKKRSFPIPIVDGLIYKYMG